MSKIIRKFKGGSLSSTNLMINTEGHLFVRKTVSLIDNREYGFQRWYSQLKRLQRYTILFPEIFPKVIKFGKDEKTAYFDIEYFEGSVNAQEYIEKCKDPKKIDLFFMTLLEVMSKLHKSKIASNPEAIDLYIYEEIEQRLKDCNSNKIFTDFLKYEAIVFNGVKVKSLIHVLDEYKEMLKDHYINPHEAFTHGNITLENILYVPKENRIILIDPYEENIIDSVLAEYSQLLQSTNSKYEMYNCRDAKVESNKITLEMEDSFGMNYLNDKIHIHMKNTYTDSENIVIKLLEVSQFIRMLPFKMQVDESKMIFFYGLASYLFELIKKDLTDKRKV